MPKLKAVSAASYIQAMLSDTGWRLEIKLNQDQLRQWVDAIESGPIGASYDELIRLFPPSGPDDFQHAVETVGEGLLSFLGHAEGEGADRATVALILATTTVDTKIYVG